MGKKEFERYLEERISIVEHPIDWNKRKDEWIRDLNKFLDGVRGFLKEYEDSKKIELYTQEKTITEDPIAPYSVDELHIRIKGKEVILEPIGTNIIGARGRVDMKCQDMVVIFVLVPKDMSKPGVKITIGEYPVTDKVRTREKTDLIDWVWKIATPPPRIKYIDVNGDSFFDVLMEVIDE